MWAALYQVYGLSVRYSNMSVGCGIGPFQTFGAPGIFVFSGRFQVSLEHCTLHYITYPGTRYLVARYTTKHTTARAPEHRISRYRTINTALALILRYL